MPFVEKPRSHAQESTLGSHAKDGIARNTTHCGDPPSARIFRAFPNVTEMDTKYLSGGDDVSPFKIEDRNRTVAIRDIVTTGQASISLLLIRWAEAAFLPFSTIIKCQRTVISMLSLWQAEVLASRHSLRPDLALNFEQFQSGDTCKHLLLELRRGTISGSED
jgi:hypothetical protein